MRTVSFIAALTFVLAACGPVEPPATDAGISSVPSIGQWQPYPHDTRTVLDRLTLQDINEELASGTGITAATTFGDDPATESFMYIDPVRGLTVQLPYNPVNWGSTTYVLPPYYAHDEVSELRFGPLEVGEGGGYGRRYTLSFRPAATAEEVMQRARQKQQAALVGSTPTAFRPRILNGSGVTMVEWVDRGLCVYPQVEVIGRTFNYAFSTCAEDETLEQELQALRAVAGSVRLMD